METYQAGILQAVPEQALYLSFNIRQAMSQHHAIENLQTIDTRDNVIGIGQSLLSRFKLSFPGLKTMPDFSSDRITLASTPVDLWYWLRGDDRGELLHRARRIIRQLSPSFELSASVDAFKYAGVEI